MCTSRRHGISEAQIEAVREWAKSEKYIREVRIFGSRAKRSARIDSDLDVAITVLAALFEKERVAAWTADLERRTGLRVRISDYDHLREEVRRDIDQDTMTILIYQRPEGPPGFQRPGPMRKT